MPSVATPGSNVTTEPRIPPEYGRSPVWDRVSPPALAVAMLQRVEAFRSTAYRDSTGKPTIGWGSTVMPNGHPVQMGQTITQADAAQLLRHQMLTWCAALGRQIRVPMTEGQASAGISWLHNLGEGNLRGSTLAAMLNAGAYDRASWQFGGWRMERDPETGELVQSLGLARRRELERRVFAGLGMEQYDRVWQMGEGDLAGYYDRACADADAWHRGQGTAY